MGPDVHISHSRLLESAQGSDLKEGELHHIASCEDCAFTQSWLKTMNGMRETPVSPEPHPSIVQAAMSIPTQTSSQSLMKRVQAFLTFDSFAAPLPAGIRPGHADSRQLVYEGWLLEVTLQVGNAGTNSITVTGQVTVAPDKQGVPNAQVSLVSDRERLNTVSDDSGQFLIEGIPAREYSCEIRHNDMALTIDLIPSPTAKKT